MTTVAAANRHHLLGVNATSTGFGEAVCVLSSERLGPTEVERNDKPWGYELLWAKTERYAAKLLHVNEGHSLSLQFHRDKHETMSVLTGLVELHIEHEGIRSTTILGPGQGYHIPAGVIHRLTAIVTSDVLEASTPELDDVVRLVDNYGRVIAAATIETAPSAVLPIPTT